MLRTAYDQPASAKLIKDRLQQVDAALGVCITPDGQGSSWWAITERWPLGDARWRTVDLGEMSIEDAFDVVCFLPKDCSVEQAFDYFLNHVRRTSRDSVKKYLERVHLFNAAKREEVLAPTKELAEELVATNRKTLLGGGRHSPEDERAFEEFRRSQ